MLNVGMWLIVIDVSACLHNETAGWWPSFTWQVFDVLTNPALVLPILFSLILLPWLVRRIPWKQQISGSGVVLLLLYSLVCSQLGITLGNQILLSILPNDSGKIADAIVVLGRGPELRNERTQVAVDLWQARRAPLIFASGFGDATPIVESLAQRGLPQQAIDGEPCSRTTEENAQFTAALLQPQGIRRILLVTDPPHILRSFLTFRSFGFEVIPHPNPLPPQINPRKTAFLLVREYFGLVSYGMLGRFSPREAPPVNFAESVSANHRLVNSTDHTANLAPALTHAASLSSESVD